MRMTAIILVISLVTCMNFKQVNAQVAEQKNSFTPEKIKIIESQFKGKTVQELLDYIGEEHLRSGAFDEPPGELSGYDFQFRPYHFIRVYPVGRLQYQESFSADMTWDLELFKLEKIEFVEYYQSVHGTPYIQDSHLPY